MLNLLLKVLIVIFLRLNKKLKFLLFVDKKRTISLLGLETDIL